MRRIYAGSIPEAYLCLPRPPGTKAAQTSEAGGGMPMRVDFDARGVPISCGDHRAALVTGSGPERRAAGPLVSRSSAPEDWAP